VRDVEEITDTGNNASVSSGVITLTAGTYRFLASCPAFGVNKHMARLVVDTEGTPQYIYGTSEYSDADDAVQTRSVVVGRFTLATSGKIELQHQCQTTKATNGLGVSASPHITGSGLVNTYAQIELWKESV
jgi:hypothetical protein